MEAYLVEWLNILVRWLHFVTGIAWIGSSLYFIWLDNHLRPPRDEADSEKGVGGEVWSVHGGGFYHAQKYKTFPVPLPTTLALVQVGGVLDVDVRDVPAGGYLLSRGGGLFDRSFTVAESISP